ncbi:MAG: carotenoid oxygenase family protein [Actinobacteria bacterium]|nr:carotenoid oxygenase family protein [Actinomycetota bacterium]
MLIPAPVEASSLPTLSGVFAPVTEEHEATELSVRGEIPADLRGAYLRNGPNPLYPPLGSYSFPFEGDGMLHGIWVDDEGRARYRNRIVWTPYARLERDAGKALWAGIMTPYLPGPDTVPEPYANTFKQSAFINIIHHGGRWLALSEVDPPREVSAELESVGDSRFTWGGRIEGMCAHPRIDPATGEMVIFRYNLVEPYLIWATIAADGTVARGPEPIEVDACYMIHDFVITAKYAVFFVAPVVFDLDALVTGSGPVLAWKPDLPMRIAVVPRTDPSTGPRWFETDPFWAFHFANAFEDGDDIVVDFSKFAFFALGPAPDQSGAVTRIRINLTTGAASSTTFDDRLTEFPRIDDRLQGARHRHFTVSAKDSGLGMGVFNVLMRFDAETGRVEEWNSGDYVFDEVVFAPAEGSISEVGYYVTFRTDQKTLVSDWVVLDAQDIAAGPIATVELPFRVPLGLHGNWFGCSELGR